MLNQIGSILLLYVKAGILTYVILTVMLIIRLTYLIVKNDVLQSTDALEEASKSSKKGPWWYIVFKLVVWPWGVLKMTRDYVKLERQFLIELEKRHTC